MHNKTMLFLDGRVVPKKFASHELQYIKGRDHKSMHYPARNREIDYAVLFEVTDDRELYIEKV